jgi:peptidoglycan-associated lipoprotein
MLNPSRIQYLVVSLSILVLCACGPRERAAQEDVGEEPFEVEEVIDEPETIVIEDSDLVEPGEMKPDLVLQTVYFELNRFDIRPDDARILKSNADVLDAHSDSKVLIQGHCCPLGTTEYNMALGWKRANAVRDYLERLGVAEGRMTTTSYGEERIVESSPDRYERNRRCEFQVRP